MGLGEVREQIKTILSTAEGPVYKLTPGVVHSYNRWADTWTGLLNLMKDSDGLINGWMITRKNTPENYLTHGGQNERIFSFRITGFFGLKDSDATELKFQDLIEGICNAFRTAGHRLNGTAQTTHIGGRAGLQVDLVENRSFGGVLCHYCELSISAQVLANR